MEQWNIGTMGWGIDRLAQYSIILGPPEASAGGRFFDLSAHGRRHAWRRTEGRWLRGVLGGCGRDPSPEPPLLLGAASGGKNPELKR
jgi:hypothetical protein